MHEPPYIRYKVLFILRWADGSSYGYYKYLTIYDIFLWNLGLL